MIQIIKKSALLFAVSAFTFMGAFAQNDSINTEFEFKNRTGRFSFYWGYNRAVFSKSTIHFNGPNYDFTVYDVTGSDRPTKLSWTYVRPGLITIPQYVYRIGFNVTDRVQLSAGLDHMKYVVDLNQTALMSGVITADASTKYQGNYLNVPIVLSPDFLEFEHSDGYNMVSLDVEYNYPFLRFAKNTFRLNAMGGIGGIFIVAKTKVSVLGYGLDNNWHMSGFTLNAKAGLKLEYKNHLFAIAALRGGYSSLYDVLIHNEAPDRAEHNLSYLEGFAAIGTYFRCWKPRK